MKLANNWKDYEILDMANGEKLERWGDVVLIRPDPQIIWTKKTHENKWKTANAIYNRSKTLLALKDQKSEDLDPLEKAMSWMAIQMSTLTTASNSKLAEILIQGNDMGIIKGQKLLNSPHVKDSTTKNIIKDFITLQQENIEGLKKYL